MADALILQKVVFPSANDPDVTALYVDPDEWTHVVTATRPRPADVKHRRGIIPDEIKAAPLRLTHQNVAPMLRGRRGLAPGFNKRVSLGSYFNAFPASYWRRWTSLEGVHLSVTTTGIGDVVVYRSNARGVVQMVDSTHVDGDSEISFDLGFDHFIDGGWYWFDLVSSSSDFSLVEAEWQAPLSFIAVKPLGTLTLAITTLNRTDYCLALLATLATDADTLAGIDEVLVVDQGSQKIRDTEGFAAVERSLNGRLRVIDQPNVGGSGGFSRGMIETLAAGRSDYVMLLDDDVVVEPESIRRALTFARFCVSPTIVGGHMFDMYDKTKLHAFAESIDTWNFMWGPITPSRHDFTASNLRQTTWMHERIDVAYNGWWMSLIPVAVIKEIGAALPVFIKWDDAEFSLRAREHGFATVSLPGAAVWHVSWVDKDDSRDWQAFYHARNRLVAALLHSPYRRGGRLPRSNFVVDLRHLLTMDYYTVKLRQLAYDSVLAGPGALHAELSTRLPAIRELAGAYRESTLMKNLTEFTTFPATSYLGPATSRPQGRALLAFLLRNLVRHGVTRLHEANSAGPDAHLARITPWWIVSEYDSVAITNAEGSGVTWHRRDRERFRQLLWSSFSKNLQYRRRWKRLRHAYRADLSRLTSPETWAHTLGMDRGALSTAGTGTPATKQP